MAAYVSPVQQLDLSVLWYILTVNMSIDKEMFDKDEPRAADIFVKIINIFEREGLSTVLFFGVGKIYQF
ncbi:hypothetical protein CVT25_001263 [Psilocybe cyanescens]|uniref:Uncharacterized protein n=1 Tax=Psilocybe cyanescens TaxID=93625 RepID=A0A409XB10_PSICY|nr:hypothetical protein CVT25_001263 [Psilocybe cyanescens]